MSVVKIRSVWSQSKGIRPISKKLAADTKKLSSKSANLKIGDPIKLEKDLQKKGFRMIFIT